MRNLTLITFLGIVLSILLTASIIFFSNKKLKKALDRFHKTIFPDKKNNLDFDDDLYEIIEHMLNNPSTRHISEQEPSFPIDIDLSGDLTKFALPDRIYPSPH